MSHNMKALSGLLLVFVSLTGTVQASDIRSIDEFSLQDYRGKVVYLDFWASWCKPCQKSFPWMNALQKKLSGKDFKIVTINVDKNAADMEAFLQHLPAHFTIYHDPNGSLAEKFQLPGMPTAFIIDKTGKAMHKHVGFFKNKIPQLEAEIEALL
jgi:thiol-disulfide isomerase/thioredoxin